MFINKIEGYHVLGIFVLICLGLILFGGNVA